MRLSRPVLFHPDFNRRLRSHTESADPSSPEDPGKEGARGLGLVHPYRRWGVSPRPENIGRPEWATWGELCRTAAPSARRFARGIRMSPWLRSCFRAASGPVRRSRTGAWDEADPARGTRIRRTGLACRESDSGLFSSQSLTQRDELWTSGRLFVDGFAVPLRRFRKSHHLIPAGRGAPPEGLQLAATQPASASACCVRSNHRIW